MKKVLVTRHQSLVEFFDRQGLTFDTVITHATAQDVKGNHVYGVLPLHLAALAETVTTVDMNLPAEMRGKELTLGDIDNYFTGLTTYTVKKESCDEKAQDN